jgi:6-phosphofructokinase 1
MAGDKYDFTIETLGPCKVQSPIELSTVVGDFRANYVKDDSFVRYKVNVFNGKDTDDQTSSNLMQKAGPREFIYFDPKHVRAGICTCGGLCPGLNDVIRAVVRCLWNRYGVRSIQGFQYGFKGFFPDEGFDTIDLNPDNVDEIHKIGGSFLGTSRGGGDRVSDIVDCIEKMGINMMFIIGGDGTQRGALDIANEVDKRGLKVSVIGIPKTVDNDLQFIDRSFGFETAVQQAKEAIASIHMEAHSQINGIGLVKLMGRESGFIATAAALASHEANFCLIPKFRSTWTDRTGSLQRSSSVSMNAIMRLSSSPKVPVRNCLRRQTRRMHQAISSSPTSVFISAMKSRSISKTSISISILNT